MYNRRLLPQQITFFAEYSCLYLNLVDSKYCPIFASSINHLNKLTMSNIVYSTTIGTPIRNAFTAWANDVKRRNELSTVTDAEKIKANELFMNFVTACENENRNFKVVAKTLRDEAK